MMVFDAHIHNKNCENGGFIVGLEGIPYFEGTLSNSEVIKLHSIKDKYISFYYVNKYECMNTIIGWDYLKFHPRREQYSPEDVMYAIGNNMPKAVMIDTLNEPYWVPYDYWNIAKLYPEVQFVFAHAGGYLINEFVKICHFQHNVWIDFSLTQTVLGKLGDEEEGLQLVNQTIRYALNSVFCNRVLLASDYPFFSQEDVFEFYKPYIDMLNRNYITLFEKISK